MLNIFQRWFSSSKTEQAGRARLSAESWPSAVYAIGDVHGCREELDQIERAIVADAEALAGEKWLVLLGDYVDRGPDSAGVLDKLTASAPAGFKRICLAGNHETMMLDYIDNPQRDSSWLQFGGNETLGSYGLDASRLATGSLRERQAVLQSHIPADHIEWLRGLPIALSLPGVAFVHAGLRAGTSMDEQSERDLLWMREPFLSGPGTPGLRVVHGHTPGPEPVMTPARIGIDTGAYATGILTAARLTPDGAIKFFDTRP